MAEHKIGTMDTKAQEKTFAGFVKFTERFVIAVLVFLVFLAIVGG